MSSLLSLVMVQSGGQVEKVASTFGVDWSHLIAQIVSFCIVCALLHRFAYRPILNMLEQRRRQIAEGLADSDRMKAALLRTETERHEMLAQANAQAAKLIEEARTAAARLFEQETQKAIVAAQEIITKSREAAVQEHARMLAELRQEVGGLVVQTAAAVTGKILTAEDQRRLADETARQLMS